MKRYIKSAVKDILDEDPSYRRRAAHDSITDMRTYARLADDPDANNRANLADLTRTTPEMLEKLANDPERRVRVCVARNPNTPESALLKLARDPEYIVRYNVADRLYHIPDSVLVALLDAGDTEIEAEILTSMIRRVLFPGPEVYEKLAESKQLSTRRALAMDLGDSVPDSVMIKLMDDPDDSVRAGVVTYNENVPMEAVEKAIVDPYYRVRAGVARDAHMRREHYELLANDKEPRVRKALALNPETPRDIKLKLMQDADEGVRRVTTKYLDSTRPRE